MDFWTVEQIAESVQLSKSWVYSNWKRVGLKKYEGTRVLRFTGDSVEKVFNLRPRSRTHF